MRGPRPGRGPASGSALLAGTARTLATAGAAVLVPTPAARRIEAARPLILAPLGGGPGPVAVPLAARLFLRRLGWSRDLAQHGRVGAERIVHDRHALPDQALDRPEIGALLLAAERDGRPV